MREQGFISFTIKIGLALTFLISSFYNNPFFHTMAELFSMVIGFSIFLLIYNARIYITRPSLIIISISYVFICLFDLLHLMSYTNFPLYNSLYEYDYQFHLSSRIIQATSFLIGMIYLKVKKPINYNFYFTSLIIYSALAIIWIYQYNIFDLFFIQLLKLSIYKPLMEILIILILSVSLVFLIRNRKQLSLIVFNHFTLSISFLMLSDITYLFIDVFNYSLIIAHLFKILSFYHIYKAVIKVGILEPYQSIFLDLKKKEKRLTELSIKDELTNAYNRRTCYQMLETMISTNDEEKFATVCFVDIDDLKGVNDKYGHQEGDELIKVIAVSILNELNFDDFLCRVGGDEFLIIFQNKEIALASQIMKRAYRNAEKNRIERNKDYNFGFSFGFSRFKFLRSVDINKVIEEADLNMYENKDKIRI